jgi:hypothetical protein
MRSCVLGTMAFSSGQLTEAEQHFSEALARVRTDPDNQPLAATIAGRLAGTYALLGDGEKVKTLGRWALDTGCLTTASSSQVRTLISIGASQVAGPPEALAELGHLDADPGRLGLIDVDGLSFRGTLRLQTGDLGRAVSDLTASLKLSRRGATLILGLRACCYLALAQYLAGAWDDVLLTTEQGFSAAAIHSRHYELPMLHLAAGCVPAGRGAAEEAERHARLAGEAAASLDYGQENLYAAMARALVCQAAGDYLGMADALGSWRDDAVLDGRSRTYAMLWRPLLVEGLIGSGQAEQAAAVLDRMRAENGQIATCSRPWPGWTAGWPNSAAIRRRHCGSTSAARRGPRPAARCMPVGSGWRTDSCCGAPGTGRTQSSGCAGPAACTWACARSRSSPGPTRSWPRAVFPVTRPANSSRRWR